MLQNLKTVKVQTINSREVAEMMECSHSNLIKRIERISETLTGVNFNLSDFFILSSYFDSTGRELKCYEVTRKGCEMLAHKSTGDKGILFTAKYIERFHEMENQIRDSYMIADPIQRALAWAEEEKQRQILEAENREKQLLIEEYKPKVEVYNTILDTKSSLSVGEYSKSIGLGSRRLYSILRDRGIFLSSKSRWNEPAQRYIDGGIFKIQFYPHNGIMVRKVIVTEKGALWLTEKLKKNGYIE
ncbi:phage regulatory protein/antirepressor Ant [Clostridium perfringens]|uniref:phage regulatory protein/antirepressor Ant n=1 Tax=Clostridium perfringens TaxID=1502 RepID=UPI0026E1B793|nr:phage regulatory protein/antirepressor Ant [Clostridium perfringens]MDO6336466.1 phage regulatory protein/antirepressor Ant [Clostridium perfringens]